MRKIYVLEFITLDGVIQAPGGPEEDTSNNFKFGGWMGSPYFENDKVLRNQLNKMMVQTDGLLLGRKTYDIFSNYWPKHTDFWPQINKIPKFVVSKSIKKPTWENTTVLKDIKELKKMKITNGPNLQVYGSSNLIQSLMQNDLVDEFWLKIFPITLGSGKKLFDNGTIPAQFKVVESVISTSGVIIITYKRAGDVKTGAL